MSKILVNASFETGDYEVLCSALMYEDHYGVPGSPVWNAVENIELTEVSFQGKVLKLNSIPIDIENFLLEEAGYIDIGKWEFPDDDR